MENPESIWRKKLQRGKSRVHIEKESVERKIQASYRERKYKEKIQGPCQDRKYEEENPGSILRNKV